MSDAAPARWTTRIGDALGFVAVVWSIPLAIVLMGLPVALLVMGLRYLAGMIWPSP